MKPLYKLAESGELPNFQILDIETLEWMQKNAGIPDFKSLTFLKKIKPLAENLFRKLAPDENVFDIKKLSLSIHGLSHLARVMLHTYVICQEVNHKDYIAAMVAAAFHDVKRHTDKEDPKHGERAALWFEGKEAKEYDKNAIQTICSAMAYHNINYESIPIIELSKNQYIIDILKYADAMDRFRLPKIKWWPKKNLLKLKLSDEFFDFGKYLFYRTEKLIITQAYLPVDAVISVGKEIGIIN